MKFLTLLFVLSSSTVFAWGNGGSYSAPAAAGANAAMTSTGEVSGVVTLPKKLEKELTQTGALFVFAKKVDAPAGTPPMAVKKEANPKFPFKFTLSGRDAMVGGTVFEGPMTVTARYSKSGDALEKTLEGSDKKLKVIKVGESKIQIDLAPYKK